MAEDLTESDIQEFQELGNLRQTIVREGSYEDGEIDLIPDNRNHIGTYSVINELFHAMYEDQLAELQGDADDLIITGIDIDADDVPTVEYVKIYEE